MCVGPSVVFVFLDGMHECKLNFVLVHWKFRIVNISHTYKQSVSWFASSFVRSHPHKHIQLSVYFHGDSDSLASVYFRQSVTFLSWELGVCVKGVKNGDRVVFSLHTLIL